MRFERVERERADEARRAPFACERELRELVRRMLKARVAGLSGFYTRLGGAPEPG